MRSLIAITIGLLFTAGLVATPTESRTINSRQKPEIPKMMLASPADVYGNIHTEAIEKELLVVVAQTLSESNDAEHESRVDQMTAKVKRLVESITSGEELERFMFWCERVNADRQFNRNQLGLRTAFWEAFKISKEKFPSEARARTYELASLLNSDEKGGTCFDGMIAGEDLVPWYCPMSCSVFLPNNVVARNQEYTYDSDSASVHFNLDRQIRRNWYQYWTGKYRMVVESSFEIEPNGQIKRLQPCTARNLDDSSEEEREEARKAAESVIASSVPFRGLTGLKKPTLVQVKFYN